MLTSGFEAGFGEKLVKTVDFVRGELVVRATRNKAAAEDAEVGVFKKGAQKPVAQGRAGAIIELPPGTLSATKTTLARAAFRRGDERRAFELLAAHIDELLETGNVVAASVVAVEFIAITKVSMREEAGRVLGYLKHANDFGALAAERLVSGITTTAPGMSDRDALLYMRQALNAGRARSESRRPPAGRA